MIVDLFAGPGGWSLGLRQLAGHRALGIETDPDACATRRAAGLMVWQRDVAAMTPPRVARVDGLIASPPCTAFSNAGKHKGKRWLPVLVRAIREGLWDHRALRMQDPTIWLPLEVGRWANALRPPWIALEQVPPALKLWEAYAEVFATWGYSVWCGVLNAADYGVPQTRKRAILIASRTREVGRPEPTHAKGGAAGLLPWVTVLDVLPDLADMILDRRAIYRDGKPTVREIDCNTEPAPTFTSAAGEKGVWVFRWMADRPATTISGDPRLWPPGHKVNAKDRARRADADERYGDRAGKNAIRLTVDQALVLQSFPRDYPLVGTKTSQFRQVGNAIPPLLAQHVLAAAMGLPQPVSKDGQVVRP